MIAIDVIKQSLQNNSNKNHNEVLKKLACLRIKEAFENRFRAEYIVNRIAVSKVSDDKKEELFKYLSKSVSEECDRVRKELDEVFGNEKSSVESDESEEENASTETDEEESDES